MEAAERTLPKDDHKERHDVLQVLPIASLFTYTLYSFDFDNYSPTNSSIPSKPFSHNLLKFIKYIKTMMVSQEIFAHDSIDSMERKKRKLVNNFFIATEKAHLSKQHGTFVQLASLAKKSELISINTQFDWFRPLEQMESERALHTGIGYLCILHLLATYELQT